MPSEKILQKKVQEVDEVTTLLTASSVGVIVSYSGITVEKDTALRKQLREAGCTYRVIKNSILTRACDKAGLTGLDAYLKGTTAIAVSEDDYVSAAKILSACADDVKSFTVKGGFIDGKMVDKDSISTLAKLPSKEVLIAQVLCGFNAPIQGFANVLSGTMRGLVIALNAIAEKEETA